MQEEVSVYLLENVARLDASLYLKAVILNLAEVGFLLKGGNTARKWNSSIKREFQNSGNVREWSLWFSRKVITPGILSLVEVFDCVRILME